MDLSIMGLWKSMGFLAKAVVILLFGMSLISLWAFIDRFLLFLSAKKQSLQFIAKEIRKNKPASSGKTEGSK